MHLRLKRVDICSAMPENLVMVVYPTDYMKGY